MANKERLRLLFCDHLSLARGKYLPASKIGDGESRFCQGTFAVTYDKELVPAPGGTMMEGLPDMEAIYKGADIRDGWEPGTKVVMADLYETNGAPLGLCARSSLKRAIKDWEALGYSPKVGLELEAYAFVRNAEGRMVPYETPGAYVYGTGPMVDPARFMDEIWETAIETGFNIDCMTSEYDAPQFEFTLTYDDALKAVDDIFLFRLMAREVALENGIILTFMPKPILNLAGSGLHVNFSFNDKTGRNVIGNTSDPAKLTDLTRGCVAGLMQHHRGMAALVAPTVNSYQRLKPASLSGYWCNWGIDHRGVTTRLTTEEGPKARIEHRMGDASASPYTLVATVLQAARLGYVGKYDLAPAEGGDCLAEQDAKIGAPETLAEALEAVQADTALKAAVGPLLIDNLVAIKEVEIQKTAALEGDALRDYYIHYV